MCNDQMDDATSHQIELETIRRNVGQLKHYSGDTSLNCEHV